jgi:hypothetical protein
LNIYRPYQWIISLKTEFGKAFLTLGERGSG